MTRIVFVLWPDTFEDWYRPLHVTRRDYLETYDGEWSISLARALADGGVDVHLVHGTLGDAEAAVQVPSGATAHFVPTTPAYRALRMAAWGHRWWEHTQRVFALAPVAAAMSARLVGCVARLQPDLVVIQDYETPRYDVLAPLLRAAGMRVVALDTGSSARPSSARWKTLTRGLAHQLLAVHEGEATRLRDAGHADVRVWPVPVRTDVFVPGDRAAARAALGIAFDEPVVFAAARLHPVKNLALLLDASRRVGATLVIAGEGSERRRLQAAGYDRLRLLGWQSPEDLVTWYAAADVVGLSSVTEGQPVAVLEAFACGRAVVATAVGGVPGVVRDGETGWLVPSGNIDAFTSALDDALTDQDRADGYGRAGRRAVLEQHSPEAVAGTFTALAGAAPGPADGSGTPRPPHRGAHRRWPLTGISPMHRR